MKEGEESDDERNSGWFIPKRQKPTRARTSWLAKTAPGPRSAVLTAGITSFQELSYEHHENILGTRTMQYLAQNMGDHNDLGMFAFKGVTPTVTESLPPTARENITANG